jgi:integrase
MSSDSKTNLKTLVNFGEYLELEIEGFLKDRKSQNLTKGTVEFYRKKLKAFLEYCDSQEVKLVSQITPSLIRDYLLLLEERGNNPGGIHTYYRSLKAFLKWYEDEEEPENWKNPISKVKAPRIPQESIEGVSKEQFESLLNECEDDFLGNRDKAILYVLYDTGVRAEELTSILLGDISMVRVLEQLLDWRGNPTCIRMDNGPELISHRLASWAKEKLIDLLHIQPGKPAQNAYIERFNRTYREDVLDAYLFDDLEEVRNTTEHWLEDYNTIRPHEALRGLAPRQFALQHA